MENLKDKEQEGHDYDCYRSEDVKEAILEFKKVALNNNDSFQDSEFIKKRFTAIFGDFN